MIDILERLEKARLILVRDDDGTIWHTLKDAKAEIERLRALHEWRDISTAPRDGTKILVYRPKEDNEHPAHIGIDFWSDKSWSGKDWSGEGWWRSRLRQQPLHWMPLPEPPEEKNPGVIRGLPAAIRALAKEGK